MKSLIVASLTAGGAVLAHADQVFVGYADGLRGAPHFPSIWDGDPNVIFEGAGPYDAGAIMIFNDSGAAEQVGIAASFSYDHTFDHNWGTTTVGAGKYLIVTQTFAYNFDTSDLSARTAFGVPLANGPTDAGAVDITINGGSAQTFLDTGHVLNTGGYDFAAQGANESQNWRLIGTTGVDDPNGHPPSVPDAASLSSLFAAGLALLGFSRRNRRA